MRQAIRRNPSRQRVSSGASLPAPVEGWDTSESLAGMNPKRAILMDNFFPQANWVEVRRGHIPHADTDTTSPVESLLPYHGTFSSAMFAASAGAIYDITSGETPDDPSLSGLANNRWQWINVANSGGSYLWICNGADVPKVYNGATWADVGKYIVFFSEPLPDASYMVMASAGPLNAYVIPADKAPDMFTITVTNSAGQPADAEAVNISIVRAL